ncbi:hypothetical protein FRC12_001818 [Ceratobasidium sp. 428]|nr:hypothetical protein FRC12_001818 [Ceratobasidium sp. 428]
MFSQHSFPILAEEINNFSEKSKNAYKTLLRMWQIEHPVSFSKFVLSWLAGMFVASLIALAPLGLLANHTSNGAIRLFFKLPIKRGSRKVARTAFSGIVLDKLEGSDAMRKLMEKAVGRAEEEFGGLMAVQLLDGLALRGALGPSEVLPVVACFVNESRFAGSVAALATSGFKSIWPTMMEEKQRSIQLALGRQDKQEPGQALMTTGNFQDSYIKPRIADHARRVDIHMLAAAEFVIEDVEKTMQEVWQGLPLGFGAETARPTIELVADRPVAAIEQS